jgi:hypothetical protein
MKNIFTSEVTSEVINRINHLDENSKAQWGKMNVGQMLAHCNVSYEFVYDDIHKKPNVVMGLVLKLLVKKIVVSETPFRHNERTAPAFLMTGDKDFNKEKERLINYINKTQSLGEEHFDGKASISFGKLSKTEWNNMFYKHLNHHLNQFGA